MTVHQTTDKQEFYLSMDALGTSLHRVPHQVVP